MATPWVESIFAGDLQSSVSRTGCDLRRDVGCWQGCSEKWVVSVVYRGARVLISATIHSTYVRSWTTIDSADNISKGSVKVARDVGGKARGNANGALILAKGSQSSK